jgi:hypothetical protein
MSSDATAALFAGLGALVPVLAAAVYKLLNWWAERKSASHAQGRTDRRDKLAEFSILFDRMQAELTEKGKQIEEIDDKLAESRDREADLTRWCSRLEARGDYYEAILRASGLQFRPWDEVQRFDRGSGPHKPLPPEVKP